MKNFLILGLLALLLFSVSAALSLWLNQSRNGPDAAEKAPPKSRHPDAKDPAEPRPLPKVEPAPGTGPDAPAVLADREARLARRAAQIELVLQDVQSQRDAVEKTLREVNAELRAAAARAGDLEAREKEFKKNFAEVEATEAKNVAQMAAVYDTMEAEKAAPILRQMAESGKMDLAAKILVRMRERNAARVLAELGDAGLATQLTDRMLRLRTAPPPTPVPVPGVPPAGKAP